MSMNFERMTDDELKRFLLLGTTDLDAARATQEAARRWVSRDERADYNRGYSEGYNVGYDNGFQEGAA